jgi:hypothetical protein
MAQRTDAAERHEVTRTALGLQRPRRLPCSDWAWVEYRPEVYHLGHPEFVPPPGQVGVSGDGKRRFTWDGGVWAVGDPDRYRTHEDVLAVDRGSFQVEEVDARMLDEMARLLASASERGYPIPQHYATLVTRATIEFGWEPFLAAAALEPRRFGEILDRFGQASLAVAQGWRDMEGVEVVAIHDDIAATRGPILSPDWLRCYAFPWYARIFRAIHESGRKVLYVCDGNYQPVLEDLLEAGADGLYIESSSMDPGEFMRRAGTGRIYLIKTDSRRMDAGTPDDIRDELLRLRELHEEFPGMMIYRGGGNPLPGNGEAFDRLYDELLVYERP